MRKLLVLFVLLLSSASIGHAQLTVYLNGSIGVPVAPDRFNENWKNGFGGGGSLDYVVMSPIALEASVGYVNFGLKKEKAQIGEGDVQGGNTKIFTAMGGIKLKYPREFFTPYLILSGGLFSLEETEAIIEGETEDDPTNANKESAFGMAIGGGLHMPFTDVFGVFGEVRYIVGFTENKSYQYFPINLGVALTF